MKRWPIHRRKPPAAYVPPGKRIYAIGDIHGCAGLLERLHEMIAQDAAARGPAHNQLIYLGDYVDRGADSRKVLALAGGETPHGFEKLHLIGNHEALMLDFLDNPAGGANWLSWGGAEALRSFGVEPPSEFSTPEHMIEAAAQLRDALTPQEMLFLTGLRRYHRVGHYFFTHAGVMPGVPLEEQDQNDLIWIRGPFLDSEKNFGAVVVHGHSVRREVEMKPNRIGIDTGAFATGKLTCLGLQGKERWLLQT